METITFIFGLWLVLRVLERGQVQAMYPPGPCRGCDQSIHYVFDEGWFHDDGRKYIPYVEDADILAIPGFVPAVHVAAPLSRNGELSWS